MSVFEPVHRAGDLGATPGTGNGRASVAAFAQLHDGRAWAEPTERGAHIVVELGAGGHRNLTGEGLPHVGRCLPHSSVQVWRSKTLDTSGCARFPRPEPVRPAIPTDEERDP